MIAKIYVKIKEPGTNKEEKLVKNDIIFCHPAIGMSLEFEEFQSEIIGLTWEMGKDMMHIELAPVYGEFEVIKKSVKNSGFGEET